MTPAILIAAINAAIELIGFLMKGAQALKQDKELTPAEEKALDEAIEKLTEKPWWRVEP